MSRRASLIAAIVLLSAIVSTAAEAPQASRPDLVVVIAIDQFAYQYLTRFAPYFSEGGFNRFLKNGAVFTHAMYPYSTTFTGPGHAAIGTGYSPSRTGIVANLWYDRESGTPEYCAADGRAGGFSPMNLDTDSLGDRLQEKYPHAKVFSVSLKDRAAILMAGRKATAVYWFESKVAKPGFTSSAYYRSANPSLIAEYNKTVPAFVAAHPVWELSGYIPAADLDKVTHDPERLRQYKRSHNNLGTSFPHPLNGADAILYTPFANGLVLGLARRIVETSNIGTDDGQPDILYISLSSQDYLGHDYGPDSYEAADSVVRTDRDLADFFGFLDSKFQGRVTVALTADHGVQSIPEVARDMGRDAGRVDMRNPKQTAKTFADLAPVRQAIEKNIAAKLGVSVSNDTPVTDGFILFFDEPAVYINWNRVRSFKLDGERVKSAIRDAALEIHGVSGAFTNSELLADAELPLGKDLESMVRRAFRADRSGDVIVTLRDGYMWDYAATTHGQPIEADQHVPVLFWGAGVQKGSYDGDAAPTDIARSLGSLLGVEAGDPKSRILPCFTTEAPGAKVVLKLSTPATAVHAVDATPVQLTSQELQTVLDSAFGEVENGKAKATVILGKDIAAGVRTAASAVRKTIDIADARQEQLSLPAGLVRLDLAEISGTKITVRVWTGPIRKAQSDEAVLDCGRGTTLVFEKNAAGQWVITNRGVAMC